MAEITPEQVDYVASLAQLRLDDAARADMAKHLGKVLGYFAKLDEIDTADVEPMMHVLDLVNVYREDDLGDSLDRGVALANAPQTDGEYFLVPKILDGQ